MLTILYVLLILIGSKMAANDRDIIYLSKHAYNDPLTKLRNRFALLVLLNEYIDSNTSFQIIFIDLDRLKAINDTYGHIKGDQYLLRFTKVLQDVLKDTGELFRIGGDEFVFVFKPENKYTNEIITTIKIALDSSFDDVGEFKGFSYGVAHFPEDGSKIEDLLSSADTRMYQNKKAK